MTVGARIRPFNWDPLSAGAVAFSGDLVTADMCHVALVRSPHPHARILSVDLAAAERMPGVVATLSSADFPAGLIYGHRGGDLSDWPPLAVDRVRYLGQEVAAIAAESPAQALAAARAVRVTYRRERAPLTVEESTRPGVGTLHERSTGEDNVSVLWATTWGDYETASQSSDRWVAGRFKYPRTVHACMEPNIVVASWDGDADLLEMWVSTQAPYFTVKEVAHCLGLAEEQVTCREVAVGGGFGSKSKIQTHEVIAAALARKSGRTTVLRYDRDDEFRVNKTRHEFFTDLSVGYDDSGMFRAFDADIRANNGGYNHMGPSVLKVGAITLGSMYRPDGVRFEARLIDTAQLPGGPFRGYGTPQVALALESLVDEAAKTLGRDPIDLRLQNLRPAHERAWCGYQVGTAGLDQCLEVARQASGWNEHRANPQPGIGLGVAAGMHGSGSFAYPHANRSDAAVDVRSDGEVVLRFGGADAGTGQRTILAQIVARELGVDASDVSVVSMDSQRTPFEMGAWSSRGTQMTGHSVGLAARAARDGLLDSGRRLLQTPDVTLGGGALHSPNGSIKLADVVADEAADVGVLTFEESFVDETIEMMAAGKDSANLSPSYAFAAHIARVQVDPLIGRVSLLDYVAAHDLGRPINPTLAEGQIIGGAVMGIGGALGEELLLEGGRVVNGAYVNYPLPRAGDVPRVRPIIVDVDEAAGPYGAKSVGEMSLIPAAPAIANAVADAIGIRIADLPITPDKVITALAPPGDLNRSFGIWRRPGRWWIAVIRWMYGKGLHAVLERVRDAVGARAGLAYQIGDVAPADTVDEALEALAAGARPLGGGTDLVPAARQGIGGSAPLVPLLGIASLRRIERTSEFWTFGGAVTLTELADQVREELSEFADAIETVATVQVRNVATIAGNLLQEKRCWFFRNDFSCYKRAGATAPCYAINGDHRFQHAAMDAHRCQAVTPSDLATLLVALDAEVQVTSTSSSRWLSVSDLYTGPGETILGAADLVTAVRVPAPRKGARLVFEKLNLYQGDFATVAMAVRVGGWGVSGADAPRCVLGAVAPVPVRLPSVESAIAIGARPEDCKAAAHRELGQRGHPLPRNAWKLLAAAGMAEVLTRRLVSVTT